MQIRVKDVFAILVGAAQTVVFRNALQGPTPFKDWAMKLEEIALDVDFAIIGKDYVNVSQDFMAIDAKNKQFWNKTLIDNYNSVSCLIIKSQLEKLSSKSNNN